MSEEDRRAHASVIQRSSTVELCGNAGVPVMLADRTYPNDPAARVDRPPAC
jgi:hypothetical protein